MVVLEHESSDLLNGCSTVQWVGARKTYEMTLLGKKELFKLIG